MSADIGQIDVGPIDPQAVGLPATDFAHSLANPLAMLEAPAATGTVASSRGRLLIAAGVAGVALILLMAPHGRR